MGTRTTLAAVAVLARMMARATAERVAFVSYPP